MSFTISSMHLLFFVTLQAFYSEDYLKTHTNDAELVQKLRNATTLQVKLFH